MSDLISRQVMRDTMYHEAFEVDSDLQKWDSGCWIRYKMFENVIDKIPSAQPEQKTGKWIEKEICETRRKEKMQVAKCSNCGKYLTTPYIYSFNHYSFCPNCGARMI